LQFLRQLIDINKLPGKTPRDSAAVFYRSLLCPIACDWQDTGYAKRNIFFIKGIQGPGKIIKLTSVIVRILTKRGQVPPAAEEHPASKEIAGNVAGHPIEAGFTRQGLHAG
jgi:hypothetical protein